MIKKSAIFCLLITAALIFAQTRKDLIVTILPVTGVKNACLLLCTEEEHSEARSTSSVFTTRLPTIPLRFGKWEEAIYTIPGPRAPMQSVHLKDRITFTYPIAGISRKAHIVPDPEQKGEFILTLYWYKGSIDRMGKVTSSRIWTIVNLKMGIPVKIGSMELGK